MFCHSLICNSLYRAFTQLGPVAAQVSRSHSRESQGPEDSQKKGAYIPCTSLNVILYAQVRFLHLFLCLPENLSGQRLPWRIFSKYIFDFAYRCILQKVRELRFRIPISTVQLHCLATQTWGETSSVLRAEERRQKDTLRERGLFSGMYAGPQFHFTDLDLFFCDHSRSHCNNLLHNCLVKVNITDNVWDFFLILQQKIISFSTFSLIELVKAYLFYLCLWGHPLISAYRKHQEVEFNFFSQWC